MMKVCVPDREGQPLWLLSLCRGELLFTRRGLYPTWQRHSVPNNGLLRNAGRMEAGGGLWTDAMHWRCDVMVWSLTALTKVTGSGCFIAVQYIYVIVYCIICYCLMYSTVYCKVERSRPAPTSCGSMWTRGGLHIYTFRLYKCKI